MLRLARPKPSRQTGCTAHALMGRRTKPNAGVIISEEKF